MVPSSPSEVAPSQQLLALLLVAAQKHEMRVFSTKAITKAAQRMGLPRITDGSRAARLTFVDTPVSVMASYDVLLNAGDGSSTPKASVQVQDCLQPFSSAGPAATSETGASGVWGA